MVKIAHADDHVLFVESLADVINKFEGCQVIIRARNGRELLAEMEKGLIPDLVLLDINMPKMNGYQTAEVLKKKYPKVYVMVLSMYDTEAFMIRMSKLGARGFLKKDVHPDELKYSIETIMRTGDYYTNSAAGKLFRLLHQEDHQPRSYNDGRLSNVEIRFLELCCTEKTYKEIATDMRISPRTVDSYRDALCAKLGVKNRIGLVIFAFENGIVPMP